MTPRTCPWCNVSAELPIVYRDESFLVVGSEQGVEMPHSFDVIPTVHAGSMSELPEQELSNMLAGLARLVRWLKETYDVGDVELGAHPSSGRCPAEHFLLQVRVHEPTQSGEGPDCSQA